HLPLLFRRAAELESDLDLGIPYPRGRRDRGAGARIHVRERHGVRETGGGGGAGGGFVRAEAFLLLRRAQRPLRGGGEVPRRSPDVRPTHAGARRREPRERQM